MIGVARVGFRLRPNCSHTLVSRHWRRAIVDQRTAASEIGLEAVKLAIKTDYALILMDMQMPNLDGLDATQRVRQITKHAKTPILAMTANAFTEDKQRCISAGMDDFIVKSVKPEQLYSLLLTWLGTDQLAPESVSGS